MRNIVLFSFFLSLFTAIAPAHAHTWDEPWQRRVLAASDTFGLFEVVAIDRSGIELKRLKHLAGVATPETIVLSGYHAPHYVDDGDPLGVEVGGRAYFMLKREGERWLAATPTAGVDPLFEDGSVAATYRISFHQALQPADAYERVQTCVFRVAHDESCDLSALAADLDAPLDAPAAALSATATDEEQAMFFRQHVALETAYLLRRDLSLKRLEPFLANGFFHTQIAAVRALSVSRDPGRNARLLAFVRDDTRTPVARVMAVLMAQEIADEALLSDIRAYGPKASEKDASLPIGSIMDPRVGTRYPGSLKDAISALSEPPSP